MPASGGKTEVVRVRVAPEEKSALAEFYQRRGSNISKAARDFFDVELAAEASPLDCFDAIMATVDEKLPAYDAPEPTVDDIVAYVDKVREVRLCDKVVWGCGQCRCRCLTYS